MKEEVRILILKNYIYEKGSPLMTYHYYGEGRVKLSKEQTEKLIRELPKKQPSGGNPNELYLICVSSSFGLSGRGYFITKKVFEIVEYIENILS